MKVERIRPHVLRVTLHPLELATLVAAARWAAEGGVGELPADAKAQIEQVVASYDAELARLDAGGRSARSPGRHPGLRGPGPCLTAVAHPRRLW